MAIQPLSLMLHIGHQVSEAVMLWRSREAACWARWLLLLLLLQHTEGLIARAGRGRGLDGAVMNLCNAYLEGHLGLAGRGIDRRLGLVGGFGGIYEQGHYY